MKNTLRGRVSVYQLERDSRKASLYYFGTDNCVGEKTVISGGDKTSHSQTENVSVKNKLQ